MKQICESCGNIIEKSRSAYRLKIELFADPSAPQFSEQDMQQDAGEELRKLVEAMQCVELDQQEIEDQVYESYLFTLCASCRVVLHDFLKANQFPFQQ